MKFLLDTNVLSEAVKKEPAKNVLKMMEEYQNEIVTAAPVWHELKYGCLRLANSRKRKIIEFFLNDVVLPNLPILPYDRRAAGWHADQRSRMTSLGKPPTFVDGQIAAIASVNGLILVSRNVKDFESFEGLNIENWHETSP